MTICTNIKKAIILTCMGFFSVGLIAQQYKDSVPVSEQKDIIDVIRPLFHLDKKKFDSIRSNKKVQFSFVPGAGSAPGGGRAILTAFNAGFFLGKDSSTSMSLVTFSPWFDFNGKFVLPFRNIIWLPNDFLLWRGDTRFMIYPQYTWGLGGKNNEDSKVLLNYTYFRFYHNAVRKVKGLFYFGVGYDLDYRFNVSIEGDTSHLHDLNVFDQQLLEKTVSSGPVLNFLVDTRRNALNPENGVYFAADYRFNPTWLGSTDSWQSVYIDFRKYFSLEKKRQNLIALWSYFWGVTNGYAPYLDLPSIGWDYYGKSGRGFLQNRYRSKRLIYGELEYRKQISANGLWGFVVFTNLHSVSEYVTNNFSYWNVAGGAGLRVKFNKLSRSNIALDFGFSKDYWGIYLGLGEVF